MFLNGYIKQFGKYTFKEKHFNHVDALVFAELSYMNFDLVINKNDDGSFILKNIDLSNLDELAKGEMDTKRNKIMLPLMMKSKRYQDIVIKNIYFKDSIEEEVQFYAITILFEDKIYVAYRGTDLTLRGWKEDINMILSPLIPSHTLGLNYLNKVASENEGKIIIGGHSKGGNIAEYAGLFCNEEVQERITHIYSFDGPGFYDKTLSEEVANSPYRHKIRKFVPRNAVVGLLLKGSKNARIVDAVSVGVLQHDPFNWKIDNDGKFHILKRRAMVSYISEKSLTEWIDSMDLEDFRVVINIIFDSFDSLDVDLLSIRNDFWNSWRRISKSYKSLNKIDKKRLNSLLPRFLKINVKNKFNYMNINNKKK